MPILSLTGIDVGAPRLRGTTLQSATAAVIVAGGEDIWGTRDQFHFACMPVMGNFSLNVRVVSLTMADVYTKAGVMLRASLDAGAEHAMLLTFGDNQPRNHNNGGLEFQSRVTTDGECSGIYPAQPLPPQPDFPASFPDLWLKLSRDGDTLTALCSDDRKRWRTFCVHHQQLPATAFLGLAVTSHNANQTVKAVFSDISLV
jgi:regulation of enolase protein 1 (concanavalin A-like superfamily)